MDNSSEKRPFHLEHIRELDGVRGIAALMVFFHHAFFANLDYSHWGDRPLPVVVAASKYANTGVDLFFVLSGFLITSILIQDRHSKRYYQSFYWKRALRILPLYIVCVLVSFAFTHDAQALLFRAIFLANIGPLFHVASGGPFWTLAIEEQFYILWPTLVRRLSEHRIIYWAAAIGLASCLLRFAAAHIGHYNYSITFLRFDGLAFGAVLACFFRQASGNRCARRRATGILSGLFVLGAAATVLSTYVGRLSNVNSVPYSAAILQASVVLLSGSVIGLIIVYSGSPILQVFRSRTLMFFGLISYALYMIHDSLLYAWDERFGSIGPDQPLRLVERALAVFVVTILLCLASRYWLELPAMSLRKYVLKRPSPTAETEDPPLPLANM